MPTATGATATTEALLLEAHLESRRLGHVPVTLEPKQLAFLLAPDREAFFGGAAGPGKSTALLASALQFCHVPGYSALLIRREIPGLKGPGGVLTRSREWLTPVLGGDAFNQTDRRWTWPNGATLTFGYLKDEGDEFNYNSQEFQFIGFDELTEIREHQFRRLFSRLRGPMTGPLAEIPKRVRSASNPGGRGHPWVKARYVTGDKLFLPASLRDNPHLDVADYLLSLAELDPVTRARMLDGDWDVASGGGLFDRSQWHVTTRATLPPVRRMIRAWDLAATAERPGTDPDWTVGLRLLQHDAGLDRDHTVDHIARFRKTPGGVEDMLRWVDSADPPECEWILEQEPGSSGKAYASHLLRNVIGRRRRVRFEPSTGSKLVRSGPVSSASEARRLQVTDDAGDLTAFFDELELFDGSGSGHDDQVDALSAAYARLGAPARVVFDGGVVSLDATG